MLFRSLDAQIKFFNNGKLADRPIISGINYFLTHENRGGSSKGLLGEKRDVHAWLGWLELYAHGDVEGIETPIGMIPKYEDLKRLFNEKIDKEYNEDLYTMQFSLYIDNIIARIDLQTAAWREEDNPSEVLFNIYEEQRAALEALKAEKGAIVKPQEL